MKYLDTVDLAKLDKLPYVSKSYLPQQSGIYIVAVETHNDFEVIYVGRAGDIRDRHCGRGRHHRSSHFNRLVQWLRRSPQGRPELPGRMKEWSAKHIAIQGELVILYDPMPPKEAYNNELELIDEFKGVLNVEGVYPKLTGFEQTSLTDLSGDQPEDYPELEVPGTPIDSDSDDEVSAARNHARALNYRIKVLSDGGGSLKSLIKQWEPDGYHDADVIDGGGEKPFGCNCLCGVNIRKVHHYQNLKTSNGIFLGSECVKKFRGEIGTVEMQLTQHLKATNEWPHTSKSKLLFMLNEWGLSESHVAKYLSDFLEFVASPKQEYMWVNRFKKAAMFYGFLVCKLGSGVDAGVMVTADSSVDDFSLEQLRALFRAMQDGTGVSKHWYRNQSVAISSRSHIHLDDDGMLYLKTIQAERVALKQWRVGKAIKSLIDAAGEYEFNSTHLVGLKWPTLTLDRNGYSMKLNKELREAVAKGIKDPQRSLYPNNTTGLDAITFHVPSEPPLQPTSNRHAS